MKEIFVYNSLTNKKELFKSIQPYEVDMYVCGPTVYDDPHIGNLRPAVVFDLLKRLFLYVGYNVKYVSNYTDVDDKIINRAIKENKTEKEISEYYINEYEKILLSLNVLPAEVHPRVTNYMGKIINFVDELVKKNAAYIVKDDVYFRVNSVGDYGLLSNIKLDDLQAGARIEENDNKENPFDFVLWKKTTKGITWPSPWGDGRPGWHTECVVMIDDIFKNTIDIHGGGFDLKFPHHTNEIAQFEANYHKPLANYWMHNGFININNEKMSKSLMNGFLAKDFISQHGGLFTRYLLLTTYYRSPLNISDEILTNTQNEINKISTCLNSVSKYMQLNNLQLVEEGLLLDKFIDALCDDLNISNAMSEVFYFIKELNTLLRAKEKDNSKIIIYYSTLLKMLEILGLKFDILKLSNEDIQLLNRYNEARINKDYALSDSLRNELLKKGIL